LSQTFCFCRKHVSDLLETCRKLVENMLQTMSKTCFRHVFDKIDLMEFGHNTEITSVLFTSFTRLLKSSTSKTVMSLMTLWIMFCAVFCLMNCFIKIMLLFLVRRVFITWRQNAHSNVMWNGLWIRSYCCRISYKNAPSLYNLKLLSKIIMIFLHFFRENLVYFGTLLSKCSALLAGDWQKSYFIFQILPFLYRLTEFYKVRSSIADNLWE